MAKKKGNQIERVKGVKEAGNIEQRMGVGRIRRKTSVSEVKKGKGEDQESDQNK